MNIFAVLVSCSLFVISISMSSTNSCNYCTLIDLTSICRCDRDCNVYKDCCSDSDHNNQSDHFNTSISLTQHLPQGAEFKCTSNFVKHGGSEGYFMISSCPDHWVDLRSDSIKQKCSSSDVKYLLPVVDTRTGLTYRNEYCSRCNGVSEILAWVPLVVCSSDFLDRFTSENISLLLRTEISILQRECTLDSFIYPTFGIISPQDKIPPRPCTITVQKCLPFSSQFGLSTSQYDSLVVECLSGNLDPVTDIDNNGTFYHNSACAKCNMKANQCIDMIFQHNHVYTIDIIVRVYLSSLDYTTTIFSLGRGRILSGSISLSCPVGEVPVGLECRRTDCPNGYTLTGGTCNYQINCSNRTTLTNNSCVQLGNGSVLLISDNSRMEVLDYNDLGLPIVCKTLNCTTGLVALNRSEYELLENGSIIFQNILLEVMYYDDSNRVLICPEILPTDSSILVSPLLPRLPGIQELTYIGCSLSVIGALLVLLTYSLFPDFRTYPGLILMNLSGSILATSLVFVFAAPIIQFRPIQGICSALAIMLHFFYLAQFSWMTVFSFEIMRTFYLSRKLAPVSNETKRKLFFIYLAIAWIIPIIIVAISIILNFTTNNIILYGVNEQGQISHCWINQQESVIVIFLVPLILCLFVNATMFVVTSILLFLECRRQSRLGKFNNSGIIRVWIATFFITGLTWILGFVALLAGNWVWYLFVIFNSTQGFTISIVFIFTKKVLNLYVEKFKLHKGIDGSTVA